MSILNSATSDTRGRFHRRQMFRRAMATPLVLLPRANVVCAEDGRLPTVRAITRGPKFHWFGYYDKLQFDPTCRYVLGMEVDFEHRSPRPDDVIKVGMVDLQDGDRWIELGQSRAWCWQQGCMLQWRPGSATEVLWNDRQGDRFVCHILDVKTRKRRTLPHPFYTVSPDGRTAMGLDFRRVNEMRPGYGYAGLADPHRGQRAPKGTGIYRLNLQSGKAETVISVADMLKIPPLHDDMLGKKHYFNHLLFNTNGSRFVFLHRWPSRRHGWSRATRALTATAEGKDIRVVDPSGGTSHFIWRDPKHILAWTRHKAFGNRFAFYLLEDGGEGVTWVGKDVMKKNGHCTYLPGNEWILNDTYPDAKRIQHVYLYHVETRKTVPLGYFHSPRAYQGEWRCDTHPRYSPDGRSVVIDSPHGGTGRQMVLIDIRGIVKKT